MQTMKLERRTAFFAIWFICILQLLLLLPVIVKAQNAYSTNADGSVYAYSTNADGTCTIAGYGEPP